MNSARYPTLPPSPSSYSIALKKAVISLTLRALRVSDMTAFFNAIEYEDGDGGKVGYLAEFNSTKKIFSSPKEKTTQEYISGKFG